MLFALLSARFPASLRAACVEPKAPDYSLVMPTYEYVCEKCGHQFEKFQSMLAKPLTACPKELCGQKRWSKGKVRKLLSSGAGLIFKGSGFYITDYRSENYKQAAKKESGASSGDGKVEKSSSGGDTKPEPAPKADTKPAKPAKSKD
jgi:putative FmdB family regulatory protein